MTKNRVSAIIGLAWCLGFVVNTTSAPGDRLDWQSDYTHRHFKKIGLQGNFNLEAAYENRVGGLTLNIGHVAGKRDFPRLRAMTYGNWQPIKYQGPWRTLIGMHVDLDWGCVAVPGATDGSCEIQDIQGDWTHSRILYSLETKRGPAALELISSRLVPAVLARTDSARLTFMADTKALPRYAAIPLEKGTRALDLLRETVPASEMTAPWMLVWLADDYPLDCKRSVYAEPYKANMPVLFVFSCAPNEIAIDNGLAFIFDELMTRLAIDDGAKLVNGVAVMPLYGDVFPAQSEVKTWFESGLPEQVAEKCGWWQRALSFFPVSITETYDGYDEANDVISIGQECAGLRWTEAPDEYAYAPVSPAFSLAAEMGFPIEIEGGVPRDTGLITRYGPYCVLEGCASYTVKMRGLGKYAIEHRVLSDVTAVPENVSARLRGEVERMLEAGSLAPWYILTCDWIAGRGWEAPMYTYGNPGDTLETLAGVMPLLAEDTRVKVAGYMGKERAAFPPEKVAQIPLEHGRRRERHPVSPHVFERVQQLMPQRNFWLLNDCVPADALYALAAYYEAVEEAPGERWNDIAAILDPYLLRHDWAGQGWSAFMAGHRHCEPAHLNLFLGGVGIGDKSRCDIWHGTGGLADANAWLKGMIGYVRLARMVADKEREQEAWALFGKAAALRFTLGKYNGWLCKKGLLPDVETCRKAKFRMGEGNHAGKAYEGHVAPTNPFFIWDFRDELDHLQQIQIMNEFLVNAAYRNYSVSYPWFLHPSCPELGRFMHDLLGPETCRLAERIEESMPEWYTAYCASILGGDGVSFLMPQDSHQVFMAKAIVCGEKADRLAWMCDVPWVAVGDLYYIDKLRETAYAYAKWKWVRERR